LLDATAAVVLVLVLGACGAGDDRRGSSLVITVVEGDPRIIVANASGGFDIRYSGTVNYHPDNRCLYVEEDSQTNYGAVWPVGARPLRTADGRRGVDVPGVGIIAEGDWLSARGYGAPLGLTDSDRPPVVSAQDRPMLACVAPGEPALVVVEIVELRRQEPG
jgi:hypothetical protein